MDQELALEGFGRMCRVRRFEEAVLDLAEGITTAVQRVMAESRELV